MSEEKNPSINLSFQYVKDLSVENPAIFTLLNSQEQEVETEFGVDVQVHTLDANIYEVLILLKVEIQKDDKEAFLLELQYAGVFNITDAKEDVLPFILYVQCPHLIFPSARHVVRSMAQESGLPSLNIQTIDFLEVFKRKIEQQSSNET